MELLRRIILQLLPKMFPVWLAVFVPDLLYGDTFQTDVSLSMPLWLKCALLVAVSVIITAICFLIHCYINRKVAEKGHSRELENREFHINEERF